MPTLLEKLTPQLLAGMLTTLTFKVEVILPDYSVKVDLLVSGQLSSHPVILDHLDSITE